MEALTHIIECQLKKNKNYSPLLESYKYNALHQRVEKAVTVGGTTTKTYYIYNTNGSLLGEYDASGNVIAEHVYLKNIPVAVVKGVNTYFVHTDYLNTPRAISNATGSLVWKWDNVNAYGYNPANETVSGTAFEYNPRFAGQYFDKETGLHYNLNRMYNPELARYMQPDPIGVNGGMNIYSYVENNPLNMNDSNGLWGTKAHNELLDSMFPGLKPELMSMLKYGSLHADSGEFQGGEYTHMHSMSNSVNKFAAYEKMCNFITEKRNLYVKYAGEGKFNKAFFELGMGLHAIMDSTSPAHEGFQYWGGLIDSVVHKYGFSHGDFSWSEENKNKLTSELKNKTLNKMNDYFLNGPCECEKMYK